jgi:predicted patatin/cPLA2 family phospholipase
MAHFLATEESVMLKRPVAEVIRERLSGKPHRADEHLALIIECGGMRGIVAAGMLSILKDFNFRDIVDSFHGSSAGACAAAFLMTDQTNAGCQIYLEDICTPQFVSLWRILKMQSPVATEEIVETIILNRRKLNTSVILEQGGLHISCTNAETGAEKIFNLFNDKDQISHALKATLELPSLIRRGHLVEGAHYIDGGYCAPIATRSARASGATHALLICTQRLQDYRLWKNGLDIEALMLGLRYGWPVMKSYRHAQQDRVNCVAGVIDQDMQCDILIRPSSSTYCSNLEIRQDYLHKVMLEGESAAKEYLKKIT